MSDYVEGQSAREYIEEQKVKEENARNWAFYLGENDARKGLDPDPERHDLWKSEHIDYRRGFESEVQFRQHCEELDRKKALREAAEKQASKLLVEHTEDICRKLVPAGRRFEVAHLNDLDCVLNPDEPRFATYEAARLRALEILEEDCVPGDCVVLAENGNTVEIHRKEVK